MTTPALVSSTIRGTTWFSAGGMRELARRQKPWVLALAGLGGLVGIGTFAVFLVGVYSGMAAIGAAAGHPELALFYALLLSWVFLFVTGIPVALSVMAYSKDLQLLRVLPVRPVQIVAAKGFLLYLYTLPMSTLILLPAIVISAGPLRAGGAFVAASAVHLLVSPLLPVSLAVFVVLGLMRLVDLSRFRTALEVAGMTVGLALVVGLQSFLQRTMMSTMGGAFGSPTDYPDLFAALSRALPPLAWAARSFVAGSGPLPLAAALALPLAFAAAAFAAAPLGFLRDPAERAGVRARRPVPLLLQSASGPHRGLPCRPPEWRPRVHWPLHASRQSVDDRFPRPRRAGQAGDPRAADRHPALRPVGGRPGVDRSDRTHRTLRAASPAARERVARRAHSAPGGRGTARGRGGTRSGIAATGTRRTCGAPRSPPACRRARRCGP